MSRMSHPHFRPGIVRGFLMSLILALTLGAGLSAPADELDLAKLVGQLADIAAERYQYRADRKLEANPPESWIGLMKYAGLPFDKKVDVNAPALKKVLCGLLWEEVRQVRRLELFWSADPQRRPTPEEVVVTYFDAETQGNIPTWWNAAVTREADAAVVSADGRTYTFTIPVDTFGLVVSVRDEQHCTDYEVPTVRAFTPERWKRMDLEIEWAFDKAAAAADYSGRIEAYDGIVAGVQPLAGDAGTTMKDACHWVSLPKTTGRQGVRLSLLYLGTSKWRKTWPYNSELADAAAHHRFGLDGSGQLLFPGFRSGEGSDSRAGVRFLRAGHGLLCHATTGRGTSLGTAQPENGRPAR